MDELTEIYKPINRELQKIKEKLISLKYSFEGTPHIILDSLLSTQGKLLRPALLTFFFYALRKNNINKEEDILRLGAAIELFHLASLVHDDIIDNTKLRRGKLTCQYSWGKDYAVLAGDLLLTLAWEIFSSYPFATTYGIKVAKSMCTAKIKELDENSDVDIHSYLEMVKNKTALLFSLSCYLGTKLGEGEENKAINFGINFGCAYQIIDDCLDFISSEEGKDTFVDLRENRKFNLLLFYMREEKLSFYDSVNKALCLAEEKLDSAYSHIHNLPESIYKYNLKRLGDYILAKVKRWQQKEFGAEI